MIALLLAVTLAQSEWIEVGEKLDTPLGALSGPCADVVLAEVIKADRTGTAVFQVEQTIRGELTGEVTAYADPSISRIAVGARRLVFLCHEAEGMPRVWAIGEPASGERMTDWIHIWGLPLGSHDVVPSVLPMSHLDPVLSGEVLDRTFHGELVALSEDGESVVPVGVPITVTPGGSWAQSVVMGIDPGGMMLEMVGGNGPWPEPVVLEFLTSPTERIRMVGRFAESGLQFSVRSNLDAATYPESVLGVEQTLALVQTVSATAAKEPLVISWHDENDPLQEELWTCVRESRESSCRWQTPRGVVQESSLTLVSDGWLTQLGESTVHIFSSRSTVTGRSAIDELARQTSAGMHTVEVIAGPNAGRVGRIGRLEHLQQEIAQAERLEAHLRGTP